METVHLIIKGKVQGVFYRANAKKKADDLGVCGWIKNTDNGNVECLASAPNPALKTFIEWCKKGPQKAAVSEVIVTPHEPQNFSVFAIER